MVLAKIVAMVGIDDFFDQTEQIASDFILLQKQFYVYIETKRN